LIPSYLITNLNFQLNKMNKRLINFLAISFIGIIFSSCNGTIDHNNQLTEKEKSEGWQLLFDGETTNGWHVYNYGKIDSVWVAKNGELYCDTNFKLVHFDIISDKEFENFDLYFEWKISPGGNSGVFMNVVERKDLPAAWASGEEYQLLDISNPDYATANKRSGCLFGFAPLINPVDPKPAGEWNQSRIKQQDGKIEFYLNGTLTTQQDFKSAAWPDMISKTNFIHYPEFGKYTKGHIGLQYWLKGISFRNIKIKQL